MKKFAILLPLLLAGCGDAWKHGLPEDQGHGPDGRWWSSDRADGERMIGTMAFAGYLLLAFGASRLIAKRA